MTRAALCATLVFVVCLGAACDSEESDTSAGDSRPAATRIVTLAPHLTELVFAAGAGDRLVGVSAYSDYPPAARDIEVVSDAFTVDQERLALLSADLVLAWQSGTPVRVVDELRQAGYRVEVIRTRGLDDIAAAVRRIGALTGVAARARDVADAFTADLAALRRRYQDRPSVRVFYQVSGRPLYTINGQHYIGEIIALCGGRNVFADVGELAPAVTVEAVVERNPEVLLGSDADADPFAEWRRWPHLDANRSGNHFTVTADAIGRPSLRVIEAATMICEQLELARLALGPGPLPEEDGR